MKTATASAPPRAAGRLDLNPHDQAEIMTANTTVQLAPLSLTQARNRARWLEIAEDDRRRCARCAVFADRVRDAIAELGIEDRDVVLVLRAMLARKAA